MVLVLLFLVLADVAWWVVSQRDLPFQGHSKNVVGTTAHVRPIRPSSYIPCLKKSIELRDFPPFDVESA